MIIDKILKCFSYVNLFLLFVFANVIVYANHYLENIIVALITNSFLGIGLVVIGTFNNLRKIELEDLINGK